MTVRFSAVQTRLVCEGRGTSLGGEDVSDADADRLAVRALAGGDSRPLRALADRHGVALFGFLAGLTGDRALAEEVLQDTWVAVWRGAGAFTEASTVRTWLYGIARRRARDALRARRLDVVDPAETADVTDVGAGPERLAMLRDEVSTVAAAIIRLSPRHREVLLLACVHDMASKDIAAVLDIPVGTVKSRLSYARAALVTLVADNSTREGLEDDD